MLMMNFPYKKNLLLLYLDIYVLLDIFFNKLHLPVSLLRCICILISTIIIILYAKYYRKSKYFSKMRWYKLLLLILSIKIVSKVLIPFFGQLILNNISNNYIHIIMFCLTTLCFKRIFSFEAIFFIDTFVKILHDLEQPNNKSKLYFHIFNINIVLVFMWLLF